jgi:hypothetical protein
MNTLLPLMGCGLMIISFGFLITFWFRAMLAFDKLVKYEYENLPEQWEKDWQPRGLFWKPPTKISIMNALFLGNPTFAISRLTFTTPKWVKESSKATAYIKELRKFAIFWNIGVPVWVFLVFAIMIVFTPR